MTSSNIMLAASAAVTGSMAKYILTQLVSYLRREKYRLGYSVISRNIAENGYPHISIKYEGLDINRLDSHIIRFWNIGNRALLQLPITIDTYGGKIVAHESGTPKGAACTHSLDSPGLVVVTIDLLKPTESFSIKLTVVDANEGRVDVVARREYLDVKEIDEHLATEELLDILSPRRLP